MEKIREYYKTHFNISEQDWDIFGSKLIKQNFLKQEKLLDVGENEQFLSFIEKGIIRFYIPKENNNLTFGFAFENTFVSAYDSFITQTESKYIVESITDSALWRIKYGDLQEVYKESKIGNLIGRKAGEDLFVKKSNREISLLNDSAEERYLNLFRERPELIRQIPLKYISSYIGVTPQALSRIRKRIS